MSSKHVRRPIGDPPMTTTRGKTLIDDMDVIRRVCLPPIVSPTGPTASPLALARPHTAPVRTTAQTDFGPKDFTGDSREERTARSREMWSTHFDFGSDAVPGARSLTHSSYPRHRLPNERTWRTLAQDAATTVTPADRQQWATDLESTHRADYVRPDLPLGTHADRSVKRDHQAHHFLLGTDAPEHESTSRTAFKAPPAPDPTAPVGLKAAPPLASTHRSHLVGYKGLTSTNRADFAAPRDPAKAASARPPDSRNPLSHDDPREALTEHRAAFKKFEFIDCRSLPDSMLESLGVTRDQLMPRRLPVEALSPGFCRDCVPASSAR